MKKKLTVGLACILCMSLLLAGIAFASIPSSRSYSQSFLGYTASANGSISSTSASSSTNYGTSVEMSSSCNLGYYLAGHVYDTMSFDEGYRSSTSITCYAPSGGIPVYCETRHQIFAGSGWDKNINYSVETGSWSIS